jgi:hypothetical protein
MISFYLFGRQNRKLDPDFYRNLYADLVNFENSDLEKHWNVYGKKENRFPNQEYLDFIWGKNKLPIPFDYKIYNLINLDLNFDSELEAKVHYLLYGMIEKRETVAKTKESHETIVKYFDRLFGLQLFDDQKHLFPPLTLEKFLQICILNIKHIVDSSKNCYTNVSSQRERLVYISEWMLLHTPHPQVLNNLVDEAQLIRENMNQTTINEGHAEFLACLKFGLYSDILTYFLPEIDFDRLPIGKFDTTILGERKIFNFKTNFILNSLSVALHTFPRALAKFFYRLIQHPKPNLVYSEPRISLIASVFNGNKFLEVFIKSMIALNNFEDMELILIDADSEDPVSKKLSAYMNKFPNIKVVRLDERNNLYEAWNLAIGMARGEYISNVNVDDQRLASSVSDQAQFLDSNLDVDVVYGNYIYSFAPNTPIKSALKMNIKTNLPTLTTHNLLEFNSPHCAPMWRKALHLEIGYFDETLKSGGDWEFWLRCAGAEKHFACLQQPIAIYYLNPNGISTNSNSAGISEQWEIRRKYRQMLINETKPLEFLAS